MGSGEMAQWLSAIAALPEDPRISSQHPHAWVVLLRDRRPETGVVDSCQYGELKFQVIWRPLLAPKGTACTWCTDIHTEKTCVRVK